MVKVSIITVSYNSGKTIRQTIESIVYQNYPCIEYIIVDGLSSDGTQDIVKSYDNFITKFISEKDEGLYHAMNKGIEIATGEIIGILNSDDVYENSDVISTVVSEFERTNSDSVFGDLYYFKSDNPNKPIRNYRGNNFTPNKVRIGILPPHPTFFVKKNIYKKYGNFDLQFRYAADFDLMTRFLYVHKISYSYLPINIVKMRLGGISTGSWARVIEINKEDLRSCRKNGVKTNFFIFHLKYFIKAFHVKSFKELFLLNGVDT